MSIHPAVSPAVALVAGIAVLIFPRLLSYIVGAYLIITGLLGLGIFSK